MRHRLTDPQTEPLIELPAGDRVPAPGRPAPRPRGGVGGARFGQKPAPPALPRGEDRDQGHDQQLSLFGVEAVPPAPEDLEGLLAGSGQVVRMGGTARVSVVVAEPWRATVLVAELGLRGLSATRVPTVDEHIGVRTAYAASLAPLAGAWLRGAVKIPPKGFGFDGRRLRLWAVAAGHRDELGFTLRLGASDEPVWAPVGAALAAVGLPAVLLGPRADGPAYRISGQRRLARLAELVGAAPPDTPSGAWP
jgi:hypothetical protein